METSTVDPSASAYADELSTWIEQEKAAVELLAAVSNLIYKKSVHLTLFSNPLQDASQIEIGSAYPEWQESRSESSLIDNGVSWDCHEYASSVRRI